MSGALQAVAGIVEIAAGVALFEFGGGALISAGLASTLGSGLIMAGSSQLLGFAVSLLENPRRGPLIPIGASYSGTLEESMSIPETEEELLRIYQSG